MKNLKIAITTYSLSPGGVANFVLDLAEFLKKESYELEIICTDSSGQWYRRTRDLGIRTTKFNFGIYGWIPFGRIIHSMRIGKYLKKKSFDLIINNHSYFVHASSHYFRPETKFMTVIHNQLPQMVEMECSSAPEIVVCVSHKIYEQALKYKKNNRILPILNGAKFPANFKRDSAIPLDRGIKILFVGRVEDRQKAVFLLPKIIGGLRKFGCNVRLTVIGSGPDELKLKTLFEKDGLSDVVNFTGLIAADTVVNYYQNYHILILPSYFEGLPLTVIEAMGNGCVPVASNLPESTDICIKNGENGFLVSPGDIQGFIDKISYLYNNPDELGKMSIKSIERANSEFSLTRAHALYLKEIDTLFSENNRINYKEKYNYKYPLKIWKEFFPFNMILKWKKITRKIGE